MNLKLRWSFAAVCVATAAVSVLLHARPADIIPAPGSEARRLLDDGRYGEAEAAARRALAAAGRDYGTGSRQAAEVMDVLVEAMCENQHCLTSEILDLARQALRLRLSLGGDQDPATAPALLNLGRVARQRGEYEESIARMRSALAVRERAGIPGDGVLIDALIELSQSLRRTQADEEARRHLDRAMALAGDWFGADDLRLARALQRRATLAWAESDFVEARRLVDASQQIRRRVLRQDHPVLADGLSLLALILSDSGDYAAARPTYEQALDLLIANFGPEDTRVGSAHYNLGLFLMEIGDLAGARPHIERSLAMIVRVAGPDHPDAVGSGHGQLLIQAGHYEAARRFLEHSVQVREDHHGADSEAVAFSAQRLGAALVGLGEYDAARAQIRRALAIFSKTRGPTSASVASTLQDLGLVEERRGSLDEAARLLTRSEDTYAVALGRDHPRTAVALGHRARVRWRRGAPGQAFEDSIEAVTTLSRSLVRTARYLPERTALGYATTLRGLFDLPCTLLAADGAPAGRPAATATGDRVARLWDAVVRARAVVLDEMAWRHRQALESESPAVANLAAELGRARSRLARALNTDLSAGTPEAHQAHMQDLVAAKERAESALADQSLSFREEIAAGDPGWREVRAALPRGTALVAYVGYGDLNARGAAAYLALVRTPMAAGVALVPLGPAARIDELVTQWRAAVSRTPESPADEARYRSIAGALRSALWDPVAARLGRVDRVFVVPDGALSLVSLATLPLPDGRYIAEAGPRIHYLSAERDVVRRNGADRSGHGLLLVGDPDFESGAVRAAGPRSDARATPAAGAPATYRGLRSACGAFRSLRFDRLPESGAEAEEIEALWMSRPTPLIGSGEPVVRLTGSSASEAAFKQEAPGMRILHLATHGFSLEDRCDSPLQRPDPWASPENATQRSVATLENPLLLSGLAFAGANRRDEPDARGQGEDGILTAEEIASLDLRGVEWAYLAACATGVGPTQTGEGVIGLRRTFQVAGARTVLMSLWDVEDQLARDWARRLYERRLEGRSTIDAVHEATKAALSARRNAGVSVHPSFWGAFVAAGDWR